MANSDPLEKLIKRLRKLKGVLFAERVCGTKPGTSGVSLIVDNEKTKKRLAKGREEVSWPADMIRYYRSRFEDPPLGVVIDGFDVFIKEESPLHSDIKAVDEHYLVYRRLYFREGYRASYRPQWQLWTKCDQLPNPAYKPYDTAKSVVESEMARIFEPKSWETRELDEFEDDDLGRPTYHTVQNPVPYRAEYRIVKVTTVQTVTDYKEATNEKDANASTGASKPGK